MPTGRAAEHTYELKRARLRECVLRERTGGCYAPMGKLTAINRLHHLTQSRRVLRLAVVLCVIREIDEHGPTDCGANSIAADNEVTGRGGPIFEVESNRTSGGGVGI